MMTPSFHPAIGGVETHVRRVSECLASRGHEVAILTHAEPGAGAARSGRLGPLSVHRLPQTGWWQAWRGARPHIAAADVVHCHDAYSFLHFHLPSCYLPPRRPAFITFHGYEGYPIPAEAIRRRRFVSRKARGAICMGDFIPRWYGTPCFAVSCGGVDPPQSIPPLPQRPSALFLGRLAEDTSIMLYLDALSRLRSEHNRALPLTVIGDGPLREPARRYAQAQRLDVTFLGAVAEPSPHFAAADFAFVSGYLAIWQALALKRLVFAVCENELKRDYLFGFPEADRVLMVAGDPDDLADQLQAALADPSRAEDVRERGAALAAQHTWDAVADLYLSLYRTYGLV